MRYRCRHCGVLVEVYLDHVGDCTRPGACDGTFYHPSSPARCERAGQDIGHDDVRPSVGG